MKLNEVRKWPEINREGANPLKSLTEGCPSRTNRVMFMVLSRLLDFVLCVYLKIAVRGIPIGHGPRLALALRGIDLRLTDNWVRGWAGGKRPLIGRLVLRWGHSRPRVLRSSPQVESLFALEELSEGKSSLQKELEAAVHRTIIDHGGQNSQM